MRLIIANKVLEDVNIYSSLPLELKELIMYENIFHIRLRYHKLFNLWPYIHLGKCREMVLKFSRFNNCWVKQKEIGLELSQNPAVQDQISN